MTAPLVRGPRQRRDQQQQWPLLTRSKLPQPAVTSQGHEAVTSCLASCLPRRPRTLPPRAWTATRLEPSPSFSGGIAICSTSRAQRLGDHSLGRPILKSSPTHRRFQQPGTMSQSGFLAYPLQRGSRRRPCLHDPGCLVRTFSRGQGDHLLEHPALALRQGPLIRPFLYAYMPAIQRLGLGTNRRPCWRYYNFPSRMTLTTSL